MWSNPRSRAAVDCREMDQEDEKEETVVGNIWEESRTAKEAILLSHA